MTRRQALTAAAGALLITAGAFAAGCGGQGIPRSTLADASLLTQQTLLDLLLGPPPTRRSLSGSSADAPLLKKGVYESVVLAIDIDGFVRAARGSIKPNELRALEKDVLNGSGKVLQREGGYSLRGTAYPPAAVAEPKALLVTLTPATEEGGSPEARAAGKGVIYVLIRLTVTDPATGANLRVRDYYSGRDAATGKVTMKRLR